MCGGWSQTAAVRAELNLSMSASLRNVPNTHKHATACIFSYGVQIDYLPRLPALLEAAHASPRSHPITQVQPASA